MKTTNRSTTSISDSLKKTYNATLSDGSKIERGDIVRIDGRNHFFRFLYSHENGDLTVWGPITKQGQAKNQGQFISVKNSEVRK